MLLIGGRGEQRVVLADCELYNFAEAADGWTRLPSLMAHGRSGAKAVVIANGDDGWTVRIFGGYDGAAWAKSVEVGTPIHGIMHQELTVSLHKNDTLHISQWAPAMHDGQPVTGNVPMGASVVLAGELQFKLDVEMKQLQ